MLLEAVVQVRLRLTKSQMHQTDPAFMIPEIVVIVRMTLQISISSDFVNLSALNPAHAKGFKL